MKIPDYSKPLPVEYEMKMPNHLINSANSYLRYQWRERQYDYYKAQGYLDMDEDGNIIVIKPRNPEISTTVQTVSVVDNTDTTSVDTTTLETNNEISQTEISPPKYTPPNKSVSKKLVKKEKDDSEEEYVRAVPKSVMNAIRRIFPVSASNADLLSAVVYIFTGGDCEISDKAMKIVERYNAEDNLVAIKNELKQINNALRHHSETLSAIELCDCYNTYDRRYGSDAPRRGPKNTEFREQGNLDMLERLREQAKEQRTEDMRKRGRQMYEQSKK